MAGAGLFTVKVAATDAPPPGAGFTTTTEIEPPVAMLAAGMSAVN